MPFTLNWIVEDHLLFVDATGPVTVEETDAVINQTYQLMQNAAGTHMVHVITSIHTVSLADMPLAYGKLRPPKSERTGWVIITGEQKMVAFTTQLVVRLTNVQMRYMANVNEAVKFVSDRDINVQRKLGDKHSID